MTEHDIELPAEFHSGNSIPVERATFTRERMQEVLEAYADARVREALEEFDLQSQDREDAVEVMEILDTGEWSLVRSIPGEWLTDEENNEHRWCVQRQLPPYCGKDGVHYWTGPTAISALRAGMKAIDHARRAEEKQ